MNRVIFYFFRSSSPLRILFLMFKGFVFASAILLLVACNQGTSLPETSETLVFADPNQPMISLMYVAEAKGYFRDENLVIQSIPVTSGRDSINKVLAGEADIGAATEFPLAKNILEGKDLQILTTLFRTNANVGVVARTDRSIRTIPDLIGKKIGVTPNTNAEYMLYIMLTEAGFQESDVTKIKVNPEDMANALARGDVDAVATWSPHIANSQAGLPEGNTLVFRTPIYTEMSMIGMTRSIAQDKADALHRLVRALVKAEDFILNHEVESQTIISKKLNLSPAAEATLKLTWPQLTHQARLDNLLLSALRNEAAWIANQYEPPLALPDFRTHLNDSPLLAVRSTSVTLEVNR